METRRSILTTLVLLTVGTTTIITVVSITTILWINAGNLSRQQKQVTEEKIRNYHELLTQQMRAVDFSALKRTAEIIVSDSGIQKLEIRSSKGNTIVSKGVFTNLQTTEYSELPITRSDSSETRVATVHIWKNSPGSRGAISLDWKDFLPTIAALVAAAGLIYSLVRIQIVTPISQLSNAVDEFGRSGFWPETSDSGSFEISNLNSTLAKMTAELKRQYEELREKNKDLLDAISQRQESEEKFRTAQKREVLGVMAGGIAHDFNNILNIAMGNLELAEDHAENGEVQKLLENSYSVLDRAAELTRKMLAFAQQSELELQVVDLNDTVRSFSNWVVRTIPENIEVETVLTAGLWKTKTDVNLLQAALLNLMVNAKEAMPNGGHMTIESANAVIDECYLAKRNENIEPGRYVMLAVSDTGVGISKSDLDRIFDPFYTTKSTGNNSGLGLSMVMGFLHQTNGAVRAYSEPGKGTCFKLYFLASDEDLPKSAPEADKEEEGSKSARVLLVEDEPDLLELLKIHLVSVGYSVTSVQTCDEAWEILSEQTNFDILVTDMTVPGQLQGKDLAMKARSSTPDLPVVFISGYSKESLVHNNGIHPGDFRLSKPIPRKKLLSTVDAALRKQQG